MVGIGKIMSGASNFVSNNKKSLSKATKNITGEMKSVSKHYYNSAKNGWNIGARLSEMKKMSPVDSFVTKVKGASKKTNVREKDLPLLLGGAGLFAPIPGGPIVGFGIGHAINAVKKLIK